MFCDPLDLYKKIKIEPMEVTYAASDLGVHCLSTSHEKDARLIWVKSLWATA